MVFMHDKVDTYEELVAQFPTCPVCFKTLQWNGERSRGTQCLENKKVHYLVRFRKYRHKGTFFRATIQHMRFGDMVIKIGTPYLFQNPLKARLYLFQNEKLISPEVANEYGKITSHIWHKEMLFSKFKKSFHFNDREEFLKKIDNIRKALVLS